VNADPDATADARLFRVRLIAPHRPARQDGAVAVYRDEAVVLRTQRLGEADRIVSLLTRRHGRVRAVAKGVRRTRSKFGARLEPGTHVDLQLYEGRSLDVVTQAETLAAYGAAIVGDYGRHTASSALLEAAERLSAEEREPALRLYLLLVGAMRTLADASHDAPLVVDAFLLRALAAGGYEMALTACARCGQVPATGVHRALFVPAGGVVCAGCRAPGAALLSEPAVRLLGALAEGDWAYADASDGRVRREASGVVAAHLQWHLERGLRSLALVEGR
jgi:DNA repair protein RecO (recombination protein O)